MRYGLMLTVALVLASGAIGQDTGKKKEPEAPPPVNDFAGKTFAQWKKELHHPDPAEREVAFKTIFVFAPEKVYSALPDILTELEKDKIEKRDLSVCVNGVKVIGKILRYKNTPTPEMFELMHEMSKVNKADKKTLEAMNESLKAMASKHKADPKLVERAVNLFRYFLKNEQVVLKGATASNLLLLGPDARKALPEVKAMCISPISWEVRNEGLKCLAGMAITEKGQPDTKLLADFSKGLTDSAAEVRSTAVMAMGAFAAMDKESKPYILPKLNKRAEDDVDMRVRITAHVAIMTANHEPTAKHLNIIKGFLRDPDPRVRVSAINGLLSPNDSALIRKLVPDIVPTLLSVVASDTQAEVIVASLHALVALQAKEAIPRLTKIAEENEKSNPVLSKACKDTIEALTAQSEYEKKMKDNNTEGAKKKTDK